MALPTELDFTYIVEKRSLFMAQKIMSLQNRKNQKRRFIFLFLLPTLICFFL
ncbi:TPA: sugar ABC transporter permease, partial [Streptococcus pneumoniae]